MIDPFKITNFKRNKAQLEEFLLFSIIVAGKTAVTQAKALENFLGKYPLYSPFDDMKIWILKGKITNSDMLGDRIKKAKLGKYNTIIPIFKRLAEEKPDLNTITIDELESYGGIGPKTSRFFLLHSRHGVEHIVFDTHLTKYFKDKGLVPFNGTPSKTQYAKYEPICIKYLKEVEGITDFAKFDLEKWTEGTRTKPTVVVDTVTIIGEPRKESLEIAQRIAEKRAWSDAFLAYFNQMDEEDLERDIDAPLYHIDLGKIRPTGELIKVNPDGGLQRGVDMSMLISDGKDIYCPRITPVVRETAENFAALRNMEIE